MLAVGAGWSQPRACPASRGDPQAPQQLRGEQGSLPDSHPACSVFHIPSCCRLAGAEDRATPPSRSLSPPLIPAATHRPGEENPGGESCRAVQPRFSITCKKSQPECSLPQQPPAQGGQPERSRLPGQSPTAGSPAASRQPGRAATPFRLTCFFPIFFFQKQLTLFFEEQQMSGTLPVPFMMLNLLPRFAIAILMMNTPVALMHLECWH